MLLQAMCREVNPEKAVDLNRLERTGVPQQLAQQIEELLRRIPSKGSLRYAYLPPDYKALVDKLVDTCLEVPELHQALQEYERCTREISDLYANGERGAEEHGSKRIRSSTGNWPTRSCAGCWRSKRRSGQPSPRAMPPS